MPIFYTTNGMAMNVYLIDLSTAVIVGMVVLVSCTGKFLGAFLPALYYNMSSKDAILLGLTMNAQGFTDLSFFQVLTVVQWDKDNEQESRMSLKMHLALLASLLTGVLGGVLDNSSSYHVAVVFLGGADEREALAYAKRMSEHPNIKVTVIQLLKKSCEYNLKKMSAENRFGEETLMDFKLRTTYNKRVTYIQEE
ncbi:hypothetical protein IFM89_018643, partial [Coptis chinensis]